MRWTVSPGLLFSKTILPRRVDKRDPRRPMKGVHAWKYSSWDAYPLENSLPPWVSKLPTMPWVENGLPFDGGHVSQA